MLNSRRVFLNLTTRCNLKCAKCWRSQVWGKGQDIDKNVLGKFFTVFATYTGKVIIGSGENLICRSLADYIDWAIEHNVKTTILTTALKFDAVIDNEKYFHPVIQWGVTMDGFQDSQIASIQKGMRIDRVKNNLRRIKSRYPEANFYINYTHTKLNLQDTVPLINFAGELGIKSVYITQLKLFAGLDDSLTKPLVNDINNEAFKTVMKQAEETAQSKGISFYAPFSQKTKACFDSHQDMLSPIIDVNGDISFCYGRDDRIIGNLLDDDGDIVWRQHLNKLNSDPEVQRTWCSECFAAKTNDEGYFFIPKSKG